MATTLPPGAPPPRPTFDFAQGFRFAFEDPEWIKKLLWGGLYTLAAMFLVGVPLVTGYAMRLMRNAARGEPRPMPTWDDLGGIFSEGMQGAVVCIAYFAALLAVPLGVAAGIVAMIGLSSLGNNDAAAGVAGVLGVMGMLAFYALLFVAMVLLAVVVPAAVARVAMTGRMGAGFELREIWAFLRRNPGNYALAIILYILANFCSQLGILLCCVGILPATFWSYCVLAWGVGEAVRLDRGVAAA